MTDRKFRPDIEGLRALAVLTVIGFHAAVPGMAGGYVGVDVFFVVSGFLITGQVLGRPAFSLAEFYARRARRILPAACVVLLFTALATWIVLPPLRQHDVAYDLLTAALNGGNWRFVADQTDYLAASRAPSPLLHYWSLGVEEQFYVVWAPLVLLAILAARKRNRSIRAFVLGEILILSAASLALSLYWTTTSAPLAYMGSPSRAWQFGAGAILAVAVAGRTVAMRHLRTVAGYVGLALIVAATVVFDAKTPYPGTAALVPVAGTVLILFAGAGSTPNSPRRDCWRSVRRAPSAACPSRCTSGTGRSWSWPRRSGATCPGRRPRSWPRCRRCRPTAPCASSSSRCASRS
ncbi:acyltransferase family protein [Catenulispora yoronensis]